LIATGSDLVKYVIPFFVPIDVFHGRRRHCIAWQNPRNPHMRIGWWLVNEDNFERAYNAMAAAAVKKIYI
jgi:hypothetical protein